MQRMVPTSNNQPDRSRWRLRNRWPHCAAHQNGDDRQWPHHGPDSPHIGSANHTHLTSQLSGSKFLLPNGCLRGIMPFKFANATMKEHFALEILKVKQAGDPPDENMLARRAANAKALIVESVPQRRRSV